MAHSFGLILPNRAVILGAVTVRDLLDLTVQGEASGAPGQAPFRVGDAVVGPGSDHDSGPPWGGVHGDVCAPPPGAVGPAMG